MALFVRNLLAQSAMAGFSGGAFCRKVAGAGVGMVTLGGYNVDDPACRAGLRTSKRRREFLIDPGELASHIAREALLVRSGGALLCVNLRFSNLDDLADLCHRLVGIVDLLELNAHCRQPEFINIGAGEALMSEPGKLCMAVEISSRYLPTVVKVRAVNLPEELPNLLEESGAFGLHLDLMKPGIPESDLALLRKIRRSTDLMIIGNNSVQDEATFVRMLRAGANIASMARALLQNTDPIKAILGSEACWQTMRSVARPVAQGFKLA